MRTLCELLGMGFLAGIFLAGTLTLAHFCVTYLIDLILDKAKEWPDNDE